MAKKNIKIALCLIVKGSDEEATPFSRSLCHATPFVDKTFVTITHKKGEKPSQEVVDIAKLYNVEISYFEWEDDFAKARNFNFSQVPEEYKFILWCDADDIFKDLNKLKEIISDNPLIDAFTMYYIYHRDRFKMPDVVHIKTQIIRNDGSFEWRGRIHEDVMTDRSITVKHIDSIKRIHLTDDERISIATQRNLAIANKQLKAQPDDPRSLWNVGNSQRGAGMYADSIKTFEVFIEESGSKEEKYMARIRMAESYFALGEKKKAVEMAQYAIGLISHYPDAYNVLGGLYIEIGEFQEAVNVLMHGLQLDPPKYTALVFNPRDYDYTPLMNMAKAYFSLGMPHKALVALQSCLEIQPSNEDLTRLIEDMEGKVKEEAKISKLYEKLLKLKDKKKLKAEIEALDPEFREHPKICHLRNTNFVKEKSSGKDIVFFCGKTDRVWTPESLKVNSILWFTSVPGTCGPAFHQIWRPFSY